MVGEWGCRVGAREVGGVGARGGGEGQAASSALLAPPATRCASCTGRLLREFTRPTLWTVIGALPASRAATVAIPSAPGVHVLVGRLASIV